MSEKRLVFLVSWHFPPYRASSGLNLFKRIKSANLRFEVVQVARQGANPDATMLQDAVAEFRRHELILPNGEESRDPANRKAFIRQTVEIFQQRSRGSRYLNLMSHVNDFVSHLAALEIKRLHPKLHWVASFGDPIGANPYNTFYKFPLLEFDSEMERRVIRDADLVVVTNDYQRQHMLEAMPGEALDSKFRVIPHCYDASLYPDSYRPDGPFRFMHVGMLYKYKRTAEPFIAATRRLLQQHPEYRKKFVVEFWGANDSFIAKAEKGDLAGVVKYRGIVNYRSSLEVMQQADALLLRDADFTHEGLLYTPFYPGKLADYLGAQKPIISVTMAKGCVPDMMRKLGMPYVTETEVDHLAGAMRQALKGELRLNQSYSEQFQSFQVAPAVEALFRMPGSRRTILFVGHNFKFLRHIRQFFEAHAGYAVLTDLWSGDSEHDEAKSRRLLARADIVFCEWGLGNAVWYSRNKLEGQRLVVRLHLQEAETQFFAQYVVDNIDLFITTTPMCMENLIDQLGLPRARVRMIYNTVDVKMLRHPKARDAEFHLGVVGIIPMRKRLDRVLDAFAALWQRDSRYRLFIRSKMPADCKWMRSKARRQELAYYEEQFARIEHASWGRNVEFGELGDDVSCWFQKIGWILSVSDFEGSHQAVAEGMASGCAPAILQWEGADTVYPKDCIFQSLDCLVEHIHRGGPLVGQARWSEYAVEHFDAVVNAAQIERLLRGCFDVAHFDEAAPRSQGLAGPLLGHSGRGGAAVRRENSGESTPGEEAP